MQQDIPSVKISIIIDKIINQLSFTFNIPCNLSPEEKYSFFLGKIKNKDNEVINNFCNDGLVKFLNEMSMSNDEFPIMIPLCRQFSYGKQENNIYEAIENLNQYYSNFVKAPKIINIVTEDEDDEEEDDKEKI